MNYPSVVLCVIEMFFETWHIYCDFELYLMRRSLCSNQVSIKSMTNEHEPLTTDDLNACYDLKDSLKIPALNK